MKCTKHGGRGIAGAILRRTYDDKLKEVPHAEFSATAGPPNNYPCAYCAYEEGVRVGRIEGGEEVISSILEVTGIWEKAFSSKES